MSIKEVLNICEKYDLNRIISIEEFKDKVVCIATTTGEKYIVKQKNNLASLDREYKLHSHLRKAGIVTPDILLNRDSETYTLYKEKLFCIYTFLTGTCVEEDNLEKAQLNCKAYGSSLAELHKALSSYKNTAGYKKENLLEGVNAVASNLYQHCSSKNTKKLSKILDSLTFFDAIYHKLPIQLIHRDLHPGNAILNDKNQLGFIDFESALINTKLVDLCYFISGLLMNNYNSENQHIWFDILKSTVCEYSAINHLSHTEFFSIPYVLICIQILAAAHYFNNKLIDYAEGTMDGLFWIYDNKDTIEQYFKVDT